MTSEDIASKKGAQLAAGRRKLEEFKRRKALAVRRQQEQLEEQSLQRNVDNEVSESLEDKVCMVETPKPITHPISEDRIDDRQPKSIVAPEEEEAYYSLQSHLSNSSTYSANINAMNRVLQAERRAESTENALAEMESRLEGVLVELSAAGEALSKYKIRERQLEEQLEEQNEKLIMQQNSQSDFDGRVEWQWLKMASGVKMMDGMREEVMGQVEEVRARAQEDMIIAVKDVKEESMKALKEMQGEMDVKEVEVASMKQQIQTLTQRENELLAKLQAMEDVKVDMEAENERLKTREVEAMEEANSKLKSLISMQMEAEKQAVEEAVAEIRMSMEEEISKKTMAAETLQQELAGQKQIIDDYEKQRVHLEEAINKKVIGDNKIEELLESIKVMKSDNEMLTNEKNEAEVLYKESRLEISKLMEKVELLQSSAASLESQNHDLDKKLKSTISIEEIEELRNSILVLENTAETLKTEKSVITEEFEGKLNEKSEQIEFFKEMLEENEEERKRLQSNLIDLQSKVELANSEKKEVSDKFSSLQLKLQDTEEARERIAMAMEASTDECSRLEMKIEETRQENKHELEDLQLTRDKLEIELGNFKALCDEKQSEIDELATVVESSQISADLETQLRDLQEQLDEIKSEKLQLVSSVERLKVSKKKLSEQLETCQEDHENAIEEAEASNLLVKDLEENIVKLKSELQSNQDSARQAESSFNQLRETQQLVERLQIEGEDLRAKLSKAQDAEERLEEETDSLMTKVGHLQEQLQNEHEMYGNARMEISHREEELELFKEKVKKLQEELRLSMENAERVEGRGTEVEKEIEAARIEVEKIKMQMVEMEELLTESESSRSNLQEQVQMLKAQSESGERYMEHISRVEEDLQAAMNESELSQTKLADEQEITLRLRKEIAELQKRLTDQDEEHFDILETLQEEKRALKGDNDNLNNQITLLQDELRASPEATSENEMLKVEIGELRNLLAETTANLASSEAQVGDMKTECNYLQNTLTSTSKEMEMLSLDNQDKEITLTQLQSKVDEVYKSKSVAEEQIAELESGKQEILLQLETTQNEFESFKQARNFESKRALDLEEEIASLTLEFETAKAERSEAEAMCEEVSGFLNERDDEIASLKEALNVATLNTKQDHTKEDDLLEMERLLTEAEERAASAELNLEQSQQSLNIMSAKSNDFNKAITQLQTELTERNNEVKQLSVKLETLESLRIEENLAHGDVSKALEEQLEKAQKELETESLQPSREDLMKERKNFEEAEFQLRQQLEEQQRNNERLRTDFIQQLDMKEEDSKNKQKLLQQELTLAQQTVNTLTADNKKSQSSESLHSLREQLDKERGELEELRHENQQMNDKMLIATSRAQEAEQQLREFTQSPQQVKTFKKDDETVIDIEDGSGTFSSRNKGNNRSQSIMDSSSEFIPLTGFVRPCLLRLPKFLSVFLTTTLSSVDRLSYAVARRPSIRLFVAAYILFIHFMIFYSFSSLSSTKTEFNELAEYFHKLKENEFRQPAAANNANQASSNLKSPNVTKTKIL